MMKRISDINEGLADKIRGAVNTPQYHAYNSALTELHDVINDQEVFDFVVKDVFIKLVAKNAVYMYAEQSDISNLAILQEPSHRFEIEKIFKSFFQSFTLEESEEMVSYMVKHGIEMMICSYKNKDA